MAKPLPSCPQQRHDEIRKRHLEALRRTSKNRPRPQVPQAATDSPTR